MNTSIIEVTPTSLGSGQWMRLLLSRAAWRISTFCSHWSARPFNRADVAGMIPACRLKKLEPTRCSRPGFIMLPAEKPDHSTHTENITIPDVEALRGQNSSRGTSARVPKALPNTTHKNGCQTSSKLPVGMRRFLNSFRARSSKQTQLLLDSRLAAGNLPGPRPLRPAVYLLCAQLSSTCPGYQRLRKFHKTTSLP